MSNFKCGRCDRHLVWSGTLHKLRCAYCCGHDDWSPPHGMVALEPGDGVRHNQLADLFIVRDAEHPLNIIEGVVEIGREDLPWWRSEVLASELQLIRKGSVH